MSRAGCDFCKNKWVADGCCETRLELVNWLNRHIASWGGTRGPNGLDRASCSDNSNIIQLRSFMVANPGALSQPERDNLATAQSMADRLGRSMRALGQAASWTSASK